LKNTIRKKAENLDENLISILLDNDTTREKFFIKIKDVIVFDNNKFIKFINNKEFLPDSYTSFKNKIGLTNEK
jgi:DNA methylase N-4/N-6 domain protein